MYLNQIINYYNQVVKDVSWNINKDFMYNSLMRI